MRSYANDPDNAPRIALIKRLRLEPSDHRGMHESDVHRCQETTAHTLSMPGSVSPRQSRFPGVSCQDPDPLQWQRIFELHHPSNRPGPRHPALPGGHVPTCPKTRGFWNIDRISPCSKQSHFPGILEHAAGSVGRKKCSLNGPPQDRCNRCGTAFPGRVSTLLVTSNCYTEPVSERDLESGTVRTCGKKSATLVDSPLLGRWGSGGKKTLVAQQ